MKLYYSLFIFQKCKMGYEYAEGYNFYNADLHIL